MRFPPVCVDHLRHAYGKHKVYEDLSLSFEMGKIYGLLGKNGVGKTTTIGKLALRFQSIGRKVMLCAADTFRAAAAGRSPCWTRGSLKAWMRP